MGNSSIRDVARYDGESAIGIFSNTYDTFFPPKPPNINNLSNKQKFMPLLPATNILTQEVMYAGKEIGTTIGSIYNKTEQVAESLLDIGEKVIDIPETLDNILNNYQGPLLVTGGLLMFYLLKK